MERLQTIRWPFLMLAVSAGLCGCLGSRSWSTRIPGRPLPVPAAEPAAVAAVTPPTPAPALYIPGPSPLATSPVILTQAAEPLPPDPPPSEAPAAISLTGTSEPELIQPGRVDPLSPPPLKPKTAIHEPEVTTLPVFVVADPPQAPPRPPEAPVPARAAPVSVSPVSVSPVRALAKKAVDRLADMETYVMRMRRRELIGGTLRPEEVVLCKFRQTPFSVYMKWVGKEANGREVIYVKDRHENKIHTLLAAGDVPFMPAGKHMAFDVDSLLVKANSRNPITDAGVAKIIARFAQVVDLTEKGDPRGGALKYLGPIKRPEFETKVEAVLHIIPARVDPLLPGGGRRLLCFDPDLHLPVVVVTQDDTGREVEYYCHDRFLIPARLDDSDFDPSRWAKTKGKSN